MESYSPGIDGFIWTEFFISPQKDVLATCGCFWAHPYQIKIYDFRQPLNLPFKEIYSTNDEDDMDFIEWVDDYQFKCRNEESQVIVINIENEVNDFFILNDNRVH